MLRGWEKAGQRGQVDRVRRWDGGDVADVVVLVFGPGMG